MAFPFPSEAGQKNNTIIERVTGLMSVLQYFISKANNSLRSRYKTFQVTQRIQLKKLRSQVLDLGKPQTVIWIFGCQRSGTTFLERIFRHDLNSVVFGEFSPLTISADKTVLSKPDRIRKFVESQNARYAVIRPLFESDKAVELLDLFPNSVGVWLFRDCPHVVDSMLRKWCDSFFEISRKVESDEKGVWRLEQKVRTISTEAQVAVPDNPVAEAYARYWLARNQIPFNLVLTQDPRMIFLSYRQLVSDPDRYIEKILRQAGLNGLWNAFKADARLSHITRPVQPKISTDTLKRCERLYDQLVKFNMESYRERS